MTIAEPSPYGTALQTYVEQLRAEKRADVDLAGQAWDIAAVVEEALAHDGEHVAVYFVLTTEGVAQWEELHTYLHELGYASEIIPRNQAVGSLLRVGPERRRTRKAYQRPRRLERHG